MSRTTLTALLSLLLVGCASGGGRSVDGSPVRTGGGEVTILDYLGTYLPREAYFAKFEILPDGSAAILFPTREGEGGRVGQGTHHLPGVLPAFVKAQRDLYRPRATGLLNRPPGAVRNVTVLAVMADEPLNLDPFLRDAAALRNYLLRRSSNSERESLEEILRAVLPGSSSAIWEYDARFVSVPRAWAFGR